MAQVDAAQAALQQLLSQVGPTVAADQATEANYQQQLGALPAQIGQTDAYQQAMAGLQQGQLGLSEQGTALQGQSLQLQEGLSGQQQGIEQQQYGLQQTQYPEQQAEQALSYKNQQQSLQGGLAASGALNTGGSKQQQSTLAQQNTWANQDIARSQALAGLGQQSEQAGFNEQQGQFGIAQQNLSLSAQANGLSEQQLVDQLNYGLAQNQESGIQSAGQLLAGMGSLASGDVSTEATALAPIGYAGGVNLLAPGSVAGG